MFRRFSTLTLIALAIFGFWAITVGQIALAEEIDSYEEGFIGEAPLPSDDLQFEDDYEFYESESTVLAANSMADFKFPFNGVYNNYWAGEVWYISNGYGTGLHTCKVDGGGRPWRCYPCCYPNAGYYSIDLQRDGGETRGGAVLAPAWGTVIFADWKNGYGWCVMMDHGNGFTSIVGHLNCKPTRFVNVGNVLAQGTLIGVAGSSGGNWAAHIHFSVWKNRVSIPLGGISGGARIVLNGRYCSGNQYVRAPTGAVNCP